MTTIDSSKPAAGGRDAMAPAGNPSSWPDLNSELLVTIATLDGVSLRDYACLRGVCTAWRSVLAPTYPCLLSILAEGCDSHSVAAFSLPARRSFHLYTGSSAFVQSDQTFYGSARIVGYCNGRFAVAIDGNGTTQRIFLVDPLAGNGLQIASPTCKYESVNKIVFAPANLLNPNDDCNWTAVALYNWNSKVAYIDIGNSSITSKSKKKWRTVHVTVGSFYTDMAFDTGGDKVYFLDLHGGVHVLRNPLGGLSALIEPLATLRRVPNPTAAYASPYDAASPVMVAKHIFVCRDTLYQVWKNTSATVTLGRSRNFRISAGEMFVLRYYPGRWPCWDAVKDLGGCSVFIGKNNSVVVVQADAVPGVKADCIYWINWDCVPMVCDIATGTSKKWVLPCGALQGDCWYFDHYEITSINGD